MATPEAYGEDPALVDEFYNLRREASGSLARCEQNGEPFSGSPSPNAAERVRYGPGILRQATAIMVRPELFAVWPETLGQGKVITPADEWTHVRRS